MRLAGWVVASQIARPVLVPRYITPVRTALSSPQFGPVPWAGIVVGVLPSAPLQPIPGWACQRLNPPLTTYESVPGCGEVAISLGQFRMAMLVDPRTRLLACSDGSGLPLTARFPSSR